MTEQNKELPDWLVEKVARSICCNCGFDPDAPYNRYESASTEVSNWELYIDDTKAALSAIPVMEMVDLLQEASASDNTWFAEKARAALEEWKKLGG